MSVLFLALIFNNWAETERAAQQAKPRIWINIGKSGNPSERRPPPCNERESANQAQEFDL